MLLYLSGIEKWDAHAQPECLLALLSSTRRLRRAHPQEFPLLPRNGGGSDRLGLRPSPRITPKSCQGVRGEDGDFRPSKLLTRAGFVCSARLTPGEHGRVVGV